MNKEKNKLIFKIVYLLIALILLWLVCWTVGCSISALFSTHSIKLSFNEIIKFASNSLSLTIAAVLFTALVLIAGYQMFKHHYFSFNKMLQRTDRSKSTLYGAAEFMTSYEMSEKYGYANPNKKKSFNDFDFTIMKQLDFNGYIVNSYKYKGKLFCNRVTKQHGLIIGTNGSGKSLYFLDPTIQANAISSDETKPTLIINDLKGELYQHNSKLLERNGYNVIVLNLRDPRKSTRFNPLDLIWDLYHKYQETNNQNLIDKVSSYIIEISITLCPTATGENASWSQGAQGIIAACLWAMLEDSLKPKFEMTKDKFTFQQIANILNRNRSDLQEFLKNRPISSPVFDYASMIIDNESEKTLASYLSFTQTSIRPFLESGIQYITSASDFSLDDIVTKPTAIFLIIPDEQRSRYVLANTMICQIYNFLTYVSSQKENLSLDRTVYFLLDEFGNMPKLPQFPTWISTSRGRNIFFCIIVQAISQLKSTYGNDEATTILQNCHFQMFLGATEESTIEYFIKQLGSYTVLSRSASINDKSLQSMEYQGSTSLAKKELVNKDQLQYIRPGEAYFTVSRNKPCHANLVPFFDSELQKNGTFVKGCMDNFFKEEPYVFQDHYYNLKKRNEAFKKFGFSASLEQETISSEEDEEIVEITEEYNSSYNRVHIDENIEDSSNDEYLMKTMTTLDDDKLIALDNLNYVDSNNLEEQINRAEEKDAEYMANIIRKRKKVNQNEKN